MKAMVKKHIWLWCIEYNDLYATYEELKAKGVELTKGPTKEIL